MDQPHPRLDARVVHRRDGPRRLGLRHDGCGLHPVGLSGQFVRLEHEPDRADPRRHRRDGRLHARQPLRRALRHDGQQHRSQPGVGHHRRRDDPGRGRRPLVAGEPPTHLRALHRRHVRREQPLHPGLAGGLTRTVLRAHRRGSQCRRRRGDRECPARHPPHDVLRLGHLDRHRVPDVRRLRVGDQGPGRRPGRLRCPDRGDHHPTGRPGDHENRCRRGTDERDGLHPGQHPGGDATHLLHGPGQHAAVLPRVAARVPEQPHPDIRGTRPVRPVDAPAALGARQREGLQPHHRPLVAGGLRHLRAADRRAHHRPPTRHHPRGRTRHVRPRPRTDADLRPRRHLLHPGVRGADLPATVRGQRLRLRWPGRTRGDLGGDRAPPAG